MEGAASCRASGSAAVDRRRRRTDLLRATAGEFPIRFANVEYEPKAATDLAARQASQELRLRELEVLNEIRSGLELVDDPDES